MTAVLANEDEARRRTTAAKPHAMRRTTPFCALVALRADATDARRFACCVPPNPAPAFFCLTQLRQAANLAAAAANSGGTRPGTAASVSSLMPSSRSRPGALLPMAQLPSSSCPSRFVLCAHAISLSACALAVTTFCLPTIFSLLHCRHKQRIVRLLATWHLVGLDHES